MIRALLALALLLAGPAAAAPEPPPLTALVLAMDVSASVDEARFRLQREGAAEAILEPRLRRSFPLALAVVEWSGPEEQRVLVPWTVLRVPWDAELVAAELRRLPRSFSGQTAVAAAIGFGARYLGQAPPARRRVLDVSGDGPENSGGDTTAARDEAVAAGIVVNGLPIHGDDADVEGFYRSEVKGGLGSFVLPAASFRDFGAALRAKLLAEIS